MNRNKISKYISYNTKISQINSKKLLDYFFHIVKDQSRKKIVKISGFGTFQVTQSPKRIGRNPKTKESYIISERKKIGFKPSNNIKKKLN